MLRILAWMMFIMNIPVVAATSQEQQSFPNIPFSVFNKFVADNFISTVSLSTVLMVLFTVTENTDLFGLHFCQRTPNDGSGKSTLATGWIRGLGSEMKKRLDDDKRSLLSESELNGSDKKITITLAMKMDAIARVLGLCPISNAGKFKGKLKPVAHKEIRPIFTLCPSTPVCLTQACSKRALYRWTKPKDVALVKFIKNFTVYDGTPVYSGLCKQCKTIYYADHERSPSGNEGQHE